MEKLQFVKVETFKEYQKAAMRTCTDSSRNTEYMVTGIISEIGEVVGKYAKSVRDDNGEITPRRKEELIAECGDVCWMIAGFFSVSGKVLEDEDNENFFDDLEKFQNNIKKKATIGTLSHAVLMLSMDAGEIADNILNDGNIFETALDIVFGVAAIAEILGSNIKEVCQHNIDKLTDRYNRNVIGGSGDER